MTVCGFPAYLHPASQLFLDSYLSGEMRWSDFVRAFSLPNSDYIPLAQCLMAVLSS